nr:MAG TPA: hypothetical protein [Caudoviricetes sp.]
MSPIGLSQSSSYQFTTLVLLSYYSIYNVGEWDVSCPAKGSRYQRYSLG